MKVVHERTLATGAELVTVTRTKDSARLSGNSNEARAQAVMVAFARNSAVAYVEPDRIMRPVFSPNDTSYSAQWDLFESTGGMNQPSAWDISTGSGIRVAVIDTGITPHSDLSGQTVGGYDFISTSSAARDGNGRDSNPNDEGDWFGTNECGVPYSSNSSWHGTHVAGTIAAATNNSKGVAGVAFGAKVVPVRVLGKCGGSTSDIVDAIVWSSGGSVSGVPSNPNPARVINMSLGGSGSCGSFQAAVNTARNNGTVVVVAAGNSNANVSGFSPANCSGVISVAATDRQGNRASYSNYGSGITLSAPGGETATQSNGILSTLNNGTTTQGSEGYAYYQGTSMAAPHVAGLAAQMLAVNSSLTPDQVRNAMTANARALPGSCSGGCGAGIINSLATLQSLAGPGNVAPVANFSFTTSGLTANFTDTSSDSDGTIASRSWNFGDGTTSSSTNPSKTYSSAGTYSVQLTVTDNDGATNSKTSSVTVSSGGSGSNVLQNGVAVTGLSGSTGDTVLYTMSVPAGASNLKFQIAGGSGDADLYVRFGSAPTTSTYDCRPYLSGNNETCDISSAQAGTYYVMLRAYSSYSGVSLTGSYTTGGGSSCTPSGTVLCNGSSVSGLSATRNNWTSTYTLVVPAGASNLSFQIAGGSGDADMYVRLGSAPTTSSYNCRPYLNGNNETCTFTAPTPGTYYVRIRAYSTFSGVTLSTSYTP
ncbi:S8 family serine peptidase [Dokdonella sp.]|uniref:S8 family serine peptidase n=1 Tax=Dokdonella sp. TaxID=2291710 RepID=UPI003529324C